MKGPPGRSTAAYGPAQGRQRRLRKRLGRRLEEVAKAVGGCYCRLQMPLRLAVAVRETVARHSLGALEGKGTYPPPPCACTALSKHGVGVEVPF